MASEHHSLAEQVPSTAVPLEANKTSNSRRDLAALANLFRRARGKEKNRHCDCFIAQTWLPKSFGDSDDAGLRL